MSRSVVEKTCDRPMYCHKRRENVKHSEKISSYSKVLLAITKRIVSVPCG